MPQRAFSFWMKHHYFTIHKCIRLLSLKGEKCQGRKWCKDRMMVLLCCSADSTKKICPSIISKFEKPHGLKALRQYPYDYKSPKKTWVTGRFSSEWLVSFEKKMACQDRIMLLLMDPCAVHNEKGITLKHIHQLYPLPNITSYMQPLDQGIIQCKKNWTYWRHVACFLLWKRQNVPTKKHKKLKILKAMAGDSIAWKSTMSEFIQNCFAKCDFSTASSVNAKEENCKCVNM